jgi:hypothetical protein
MGIIEIMASSFCTGTRGFCELRSAIISDNTAEAAKNQSQKLARYSFP